MAVVEKRYYLWQIFWTFILFVVDLSILLWKIFDKYTVCGNFFGTKILFVIVFMDKILFGANFINKDIICGRFGLTQFMADL